VQRALAYLGLPLHPPRQSGWHGEGALPEWSAVAGTPPTAVEPSPDLDRAAVERVVELRRHTPVLAPLLQHALGGTLPLDRYPFVDGDDAEEHVADPFERALASPRSELVGSWAFRRRSAAGGAVAGAAVSLLAGAQDGAGDKTRAPAAPPFDPGSPTASPPATTSVLAPAAGAWPAEASRWSGEAPEAGQVTAPSPRQASRAPSAAGLLPRAEDDTARRSPARPVSTTDPLAAAGITRPKAEGQPLEYRGRPLHLARSRRFAWDYEIPAVRRAAGPLRAELWTTRDGGLTWQKAAIDKDGRSPIDVELAEGGFYGVRLELVADVPDADGGPRSGAEPDAWIGIDEEPPQVELVGVDRDETTATDALLIRYAARDPLLGSNSVRLLYSPNAEGPWATIATVAANEGIHRWEPGKNVPARVFIRVEATDAAGNQAAAVGEEAVSVAPTRFGGRLGGLRVVPTP
jgi:hypothetical protein